MLCMAVLSLTPDEQNLSDSAFVWLLQWTPKLAQKLLHVCFYALLTVSLTWNFRCIGSSRGRLLTSLGTALGFGVLMEYLQTFVPGRYGSATDVLLDAVGCVLALGLMHRARVAST
jgi:VanZ family protein